MCLCVLKWFNSHKIFVFRCVRVPETQHNQLVPPALESLNSFSLTESLAPLEKTTNGQYNVASKKKAASFGRRPLLKIVKSSLCVISFEYRHSPLLQLENEKEEQSVSYENGCNCCQVPPFSSDQVLCLSLRKRDMSKISSEVREGAGRNLL
ncbi:hypothetical protein ABFS83_12G051200 [Erythranthe nasuta]